MNLFGTNLRMLRLERHLTQDDLAKELHLTPVDLSRYENKRRQPTPERLHLLANFFNVSTDYLLGRTHIKVTFNIGAFSQHPDLTQWYIELITADESELLLLQEKWIQQQKLNN